MAKYIFNFDQRFKEKVQYCLQKLNDLGVPISQSIYFAFNKGFSYYGRTHFGKKIKEKYDCDYYITLNKFLITDKDIMNTAVHELLHTVKGGMTHGGEWKKWKLFVNKNSEFKVTILSKVKLDSGAYKNKKVFLEGDFNPQTMELLQCPKCCRKIAVKKGTCKTKDGKCKYFCSTCKKRFEYV